MMMIEIGITVENFTPKKFTELELLVGEAAKYQVEVSIWLGHYPTSNQALPYYSKWL